MSGFSDGYAAAKRHYDLDRAVIRNASTAWQDPDQEKARSVIRIAWPELAAALDRIADHAMKLL